ncbi:MAG: penicillin-binding protein 2 [Hyphomonadaceae bacterium]|nr:MAG: penicillin-binding protein 2 [Hyphomonadaceae bacterium]
MSDKEVLFDRRAILLSGFGGLAFSALGLRMAQLQIFQNSQYRTEASENQFNLVVLPASRGPVYDRFGIPLAVNRRDFRVTIIKDEVGRRQDVENTIDAVGAIIGMDVVSIAKVKEQSKTSLRFVPTQIAGQLSWEQYSKISLYSANFVGVHPEMGEARHYPLGEAFAHVIGYVAKATSEEVKLDPATNNPGIRVGKEGLEKSQEIPLKGRHGATKYEVNAHGKIAREVYDPSLTPVPGEPIVLTIDAELQQLAYDQFVGESGSAVVMDIQTGDILVLASAPAFDPNKFIDGIGSADYSAYLNNEYRPLYHKAIRGTYPPGSTFKTIMSIAALENQVVTPEETVFCPGSYRVGNALFHCGGRHGNIAMHNAIKASCDVYFYEMGKRLGGEKMAETARKYGLGAAYDLGIPGVAKGVIPDAAWKLNRVKTGWEIYDSINMVIGQGYVAASPLQLAVMAARIASFGKAVVPRLIKSGAGAVPAVPFANIGSKLENLQVVHGGMFGVTNEGGGTARADLGIEGVQIAGKTGTSQVRRITMAERRGGVRSNASLPWKFRDNGLFVCFGPFDSPRYCCAVVVEHGGGGGRAAAPRARAIMKATLLKNPGNMPIFEPNRAAAAASTDDSKTKKAGR